MGTQSSRGRTVTGESQPDMGIKFSAFLKLFMELKLNVYVSLQQIFKR